jgi:hypothetical protein
MQRRKKGQHEVLTLILMTVIMLGIMTAVWMWVIPIIESNKQDFSLSQTEDFTKKLASSIKIVAKNGGKMEISMRGMDPTGDMMINPDSIEIFATSLHTPYEKDVQIPLTELDCNAVVGQWGLDSPASICVTSTTLGKDKFRTKFSIKLINLFFDELDSKLTNTGYNITLIPLTRASGLGKKAIILEKKGVSQGIISDASGKGRTLISTLIEVSTI